MRVARCSITQQITGSARPIVNIVDVEVPDGTFMSYVADTVRNAWASHLMPYATSKSTMQQVEVLAFDTKEYAVNAVPQVGTGTATVVPPSTTYLIKKLLASGPRKGYGRMYFSPIAESSVDDAGTLSAGAVTGMQTAINAFDAALRAAATPVIPGVAKTGPGGVLLSFSPIASWSVDARAATQRRRLRK